MKYDKFLVKQRDLTDCGAACLLMVIKYYKGNNSIESIRDLSGTTKDGTTLLGLHQAADKLGFKSQGCEADLKSIQEHGKPLILHLIHENLEHFVVLFKYNDKENTFTIGDPELGLLTYTEEELLSKWVSKICLVLDVIDNFQESNKLNSGVKSKLNWVVSFLKKDTDLLVFSTVIGVVVAISGLGTSVFSQYLIDNIISSNNKQKLIVGASLLGLILIINSVLSYIRSILLYRQRKEFNIRVNNYFLDNLLKLPLSFFKTRKTGDFVSRLNDSFKIQNFIDQVVGTLVIDTLIVVASLSLLFYYSSTVGFLALVMVPIYILIMYVSNKKLLRLQKESMIGYSNTESSYIDLVSGVQTIKLFGKESFFVNKSESAIKDFQNKEYELKKSASSVTFKWSLVNNIFLTVIILSASFLVINGTIKVGALIGMLGIFAYFLPSITRIAMIILPFNESKVAFNRMQEYAENTKEDLTGNEVDRFETLQIKNLNYRYTGRQLLLNNVNIDIKKNNITALVGESGCGKSTIVSLLQQIYDFESGDILLNNESLKNYSLDSWRKALGLISQQPDFFNGTVLDNIVMDRYDLEEKENVIAFMKEYGLDTFIQKLDYGYDTLVGEGGSNISGGQRQIISFARVLYKNPKFLILDEATSAMDKNTEKFFIELLTKLKSQMPIFYITHRLETLKNFADSVYVMDQGYIIDHFKNNEDMAIDLIDNKYKLVC